MAALTSIGVFGLASMFPPIYTQAVMSGQGLAGAVVAISQMLTLIAGSAKKSTDTNKDPEDADTDVSWVSMLAD